MTSMYSSTQLDIINKIKKCIKKNTNLFGLFDSVYLFGSILNAYANPNDIDILLIYSALSNNVINEFNTMCNVLEESCGLPIDLTVLSLDEEKETDFLKKINSYLKLK